MKKGIIVLSAFVLFMMAAAFAPVHDMPVAVNKNVNSITDPDSLVAALPEVKEPETKLSLYKKDVLATYYADKFNGRKTSSGERFHNNNYTAAHMKLPFGTMVRVTNEANGKYVDVKVNDRGPYSKKLEIDLTKKAFMEIAPNKNCGSFKVKIEIIE